MVIGDVRGLDMLVSATQSNHLTFHALPLMPTGITGDGFGCRGHEHLKMPKTIPLIAIRFPEIRG